MAEEILHRSAARSLPVVLWMGGGEGGDPSAATVHVSVCLPEAAGEEERLRLEADGLGALDLDLSSAARLVRGAEAVLRLLQSP